LSQIEMMRIRLGMVDDHENRISNLENNMTLDYGQQRVLEDTVNKTVIDVLGGKGADAYKEIGKKDGSSWKDGGEASGEAERGRGVHTRD